MSDNIDLNNDKKKKLEEARKARNKQIASQYSKKAVLPEYLQADPEIEKEIRRLRFLHNCVNELEFVPSPLNDSTNMYELLPKPVIRSSASRYRDVLVLLFGKQFENRIQYLEESGMYLLKFSREEAEEIYRQRYSNNK